MDNVADSSSGVAFVTGAAWGIGAEVARRLGAEGRTVAALDLRSCAETVESITAAGGVAVGYECDTTDWTQLEHVVEQVESQLGPIEAVAAVAGKASFRAFLDMDRQDWNEVVDVNLLGTFQTCRLTAGPMAGRGRGAIVCISSNSAQLAWEGCAHYSAAKAGIIGLMKVMALELGRHGIRVNAICPGVIRTPATEGELSDPQVRSELTRYHPVGRIGAPADVAEAVAFLLNPETAGFITGETLLVDGGYGTHGEGSSLV